MANAIETGVSPCAVIGGGPAGLIAALALAHFKVPATLVARRPAGIDNRTTALLAGSVAALEALGVWEACRPHAAPLRVMRIADDTSRLWRAPEVRFEAEEIGLPAFGWNIENSRLIAALWDRVGGASGLDHVDSAARSIEIGDTGVTVTTANGSFAVVARDRRRRAPFALPQGGGHCRERTDDAPDCADLHYEPLPASL